MLTKCPECELPVSDKAISCPHCGYPLKEPNIKRSKYRKAKRQRLPNGFGQISELKGKNLRKPFRAMVTIGKTDEGRPICKLLQPEAYFETYNDAYTALVEYNKNPYDFTSEITVEELHDRWFKAYSESVEPGTVRHIKSAWNYCNAVKHMNIKELRPRHIKMCIEHGTAMVNGKEKAPTPIVRQNIKTTFSKMFDYALEYELVDRNYAKDVKLSRTDQKKAVAERVSHIPYSDEEITALWENINAYPLAEIIIFQCYTGWRPGELERLETKNINLQEGIMTGGMKTIAGKNRIVPIHSRIRPIVEKWYKEAISEDREYLIGYPSSLGRKSDTLTYFRYNTNLKKLIKTLNLNPAHRPHDGRSHFVTMAKKYQMNDYAIKHIVGHEIKDITESIYTKRDPKWLKSEIEKIP